MINTGGHLMNDQNYDLIYMILDLSVFLNPETISFNDKTKPMLWKLGSKMNILVRNPKFIQSLHPYQHLHLHATSDDN